MTNLTIFVKRNPLMTLPSKAHESDAKYDIVAALPPTIVGQSIQLAGHGTVWSHIDYIEYQTNLAIAPQEVLGGQVKFHTLIYPRSSISRYNLLLANSIGVIDNGFRNFISLRMKYVVQPEDLIIIPEFGGNKVYAKVNELAIYAKGDKIGQISAHPSINLNFEVVENLNETDRNMGGFGSSGV